MTTDLAPTTVTAPFDYTDAPEATKTRLQNIAIDFKNDTKATVAKWIDQGSQLKEARDLLKYRRDGGFVHYIECELQISWTWADKLIRVHDELGKIPLSWNIAAGAILKLVDSRSPGAVSEAIELASTGVVVTPEVADAVIAKNPKPDKPKKDKPAKAEKPPKKPRIQTVEGDEAPADDPTFEHAEPDDVPPMLQRDDDEPEPDHIADPGKKVAADQPRRREPNEIGDVIANVRTAVEPAWPMVGPKRSVIALALRELADELEAA